MNVLRLVLAVGIFIVWATVYLAAAFSHGQFNAPPELSGVMVAAITYLLGSAFRTGDRGPSRFARAAKILLSNDDDSKEPDAD